MRALVLLFPFIFLALCGFSQQISVKSFRSLPTDMDARINFPKTDQNGEKCAIIKVVTTETGFSWEPDMMGIISSEKKTGEYWLYVPKGAKKLTIKHNKLGVLRDYYYTEPIEESTCYELVLVTAKVVTTVIENQVETQWVTFTCQPDTADVYINDLHRGQTPFQMELAEGEYTYRLEKEMYHPEAGKFNLVAAQGKKEMNIKLKPNFGNALITANSADGIAISIDGQAVEKQLPFNTGRLKSGKHTLTATKNLYHDLSHEFTITDNQTTNLNLQLKPAFGAINITSKPEQGAIIVLDGKETSFKTPYKLDKIRSGEHTLSLRLEWFEPKTQKVTIADGQEASLPFELQATFGTVKLTTDSESEIFIDNQRNGKGNWEGRLIAGWHTFEARKDKHHNATQKIEIQVGDTKEINLAPAPMYGMLKIQTTPFGATIALNGKEYGTTPATIKNLLVGDYTVLLSKTGFSTLTKTIAITENTTTELNENLPNGMEVNITSSPAGAQLCVDGVSTGSTPWKGTLSFGSHAIKLVNGKKTLDEKINVTQDEKTRWEFDVAEFPPTGTFTDSRDGKTYKYVTIGNQVWMAENLAYESGRGGYWAYDNIKSNVAKYGYLYDWETAKKVCPTGWHLPGIGEWKQLENTFESKAGKKLKAKRGWSNNGNGIDEFGFSALPGGSRDVSGSFNLIGSSGTWWSATENVTTFAWYQSLSYYSAYVSRSDLNKSNGFSVRCLKD